MTSDKIKLSNRFLSLQGFFQPRIPLIESLAAAAALPGVARFTALMKQISAEVHGRIGALDEALELVLAAVDTGLLDLTWLDCCPPLSELRADPRFVTARDEVAGRLTGALAALEGH